jgi:hypothetical protein
MARRILSRINSAHVIATIALFAALGGGYATAFSGSGTVQKGADLNLPSSPTVVRSLTGIGSIKAQCVTGDVTIFFENTSGKTLNVFGTGLDENTELADVASGSGNQFVDASVLGTNSINLHISPVNGTKTPQADVQISAKRTNNCTTSYVTVLATNTQE